jgi:hypothetical protein
MRIRNSGLFFGDTEMNVFCWSESGQRDGSAPGALPTPLLTQSVPVQGKASVNYYILFRICTFLLMFIVLLMPFYALFVGILTAFSIFYMVAEMRSGYQIAGYFSSFRNVLIFIKLRYLTSRMPNLGNMFKMRSSLVGFGARSDPDPDP